MFKLYIRSVGKGERLHRELADLIAFNIHICALSVDLVNEFLSAVPRDKYYAERIASTNQMYDLITAGFVAAEGMLNENNGFSTSDRTAILNAMAETLPTVKKIFASDFRGELRKKLEADKPALKGKSDGQTIERMLNELNS